MNHLKTRWGWLWEPLILGDGKAQACFSHGTCNCWRYGDHSLFPYEEQQPQMLHPYPLEFLGNYQILWGAISWNWVYLCWSFLKEKCWENEQKIFFWECFRGQVLAVSQSHCLGCWEGTVQSQGSGRQNVFLLSRDLFFPGITKYVTSHTDTFVKSPLNASTAHFSSASLPET